MREEEVLKVCDHYCGKGMDSLKKICNSLIKVYGGITESDYDDFYSIANETVWRAAKMFDESIHDSFEKYLIDCLDKRFKSVMTKRNRKKRIPAKNVVSLDAKVSEDSNHTYAEVLDSGYDLAKEIPELQDNGMEMFMQRLSRKQKMICELIMQGYKKNEIICILQISVKRYDSCMDMLRSYETRILLSGEYED